MVIYKMTMLFNSDYLFATSNTYLDVVGVASAADFDWHVLAPFFLFFIFYIRLVT